MRTPLRFAIIGCGRIAQRHAVIIAEVGQLVAVCDVDREKADSFAQRYSAQPYYDHTALLDELKTRLDAVVVCSPNGLHASHSIEALEAGFHVLCEKPMAIASADAKAMLDAAATMNRHLVIVKQNRYNPPVVAVKQLLDEGRLGRILSVQCNGLWNRPNDYYEGSWRGTLAMDGGTLYTQFSHFLDVLIWLFGSLEPACALIANQLHQGVIETEDTGLVNGRFSSGALFGMHYSVNSFERNMEGSVTILGEKGTIRIGGQYLNIIDYQCVSGSKIEIVSPGNPPNEYGRYQGSMSNHPAVYQSFLRQLLEPPAISSALEEAAATVDVIEKIYQLAGRQNRK